jgi:hypothetical protein
MSKGKKAKEHRRKVMLRNERIKHEKRKMQKAQQEMLMKLIEQEKEKGSFDAPVMSMPGFEGPNLGLDTNSTETVTGPQI